VSRIFIPEDNDEPGRCFAREKAHALAGIVPDIRIVAFPDVPEGEDVSCWLTELKHRRTDLDRLREKVRAIGDVNTILIDPVTAYLGLGKVGSYRATDVRAVLGPLKDFAEELSAAVIGIMHFNKKIDVTNVLLRVSDSLAFVAAPRHVFGVVDDSENGRKLVVRAKNNLVDAEQKRKSLAFHFDMKQVGTDARNGKPIEAPFVVWEPGYVDVTATEALSAASENKSPTALEDAREFLRNMLTDGGGCAPQAEIEEAAEAEKGSPQDTAPR
jgi:hypothetical protein